jgi:hypothetical protein
MDATQPLPDANIRSSTYYVASTDARCWHCGSSTRLLALAVPRHHETLDADTATDGGERDDPAPDAWQSADVNAFLFYVERLTDDVERRLNQLSRHFRPEHSATAPSSYWANHCEHCCTLLGDHELHCEPDGAFMPSSESAAANIQLLQIHAPFEAAAVGYAPEPEFFGCMRRS